VTLRAPELRPDLSDLQIDFRVSPTRRMVELHAVYEDGELRLPERLDLVELKDARVKVVVRVPKGPGLLSRELAIQSLKNIEHRKPRSLTLKRRSMVLILPPRQRKMVTNEVRAGELRITQTQP